MCVLDWHFLFIPATANINITTQWYEFSTKWAFFFFYFLTYSVVLVRKLTIPTERPSLVGEVTANFYG
jgi:hypothetical protein